MAFQDDVFHGVIGLTWLKTPSEDEPWNLIRLPNRGEHCNIITARAQRFADIRINASADPVMEESIQWMKARN